MSRVTTAAPRPSLLERPYRRVFRALARWTGGPGERPWAALALRWLVAGVLLLAFFPVWIAHFGVNFIRMGVRATYENSSREDLAKPRRNRFIDRVDRERERQRAARAGTDLESAPPR